MFLSKVFDNKVRNGIVKIFKSDGKSVNGTGFFVKPDFCLTCYHVIKDLVSEDISARIEIEYRGKSAEAYYCEEKSNPEKDIAVLKVEIPEVKTLPLARGCERGVGKKSTAYGYRKGFPNGFPADGILGPNVSLPLRKDLPKKGISEEETSEEKTSAKEEDYVSTHVLTTSLPSRASLAGMSGCPVYSVRYRRVIGMLKGEEAGGPGVSYIIPMDVIYEKWPELRPSWWKDTAYGTLVGTEKWEELPWLFIFLFLIVLPFLFNTWLHGTFGVNRPLVYIAAIPLFITFVWAIFRAVPESSLGKLRFLQRPLRIRHFLRMYSIVLAFLSFVGFMDALPAYSGSVFDRVYSAFDGIYPNIYRLSRKLNLAFTSPPAPPSTFRDKWRDRLGREVQEPEMVYIEAGSFQMGITEEKYRDLMNLPSRDLEPLEAQLSSEMPSRSVWLNDYCIGKYEVTNADYYEFLREMEGEGLKKNVPQCWDFDPTLNDAVPEELRERPVLVYWFQAESYCKWLSEMTGKKYRLPTEAEWEKAARGIDREDNFMLFPWGDTQERNTYMQEKYAKFGIGSGGSCPKSSDLVGLMERPKGQSPYNCFNMAGNALEWCQDWYDARYYARGRRTNPKGPSKGEMKVCRGGAYFTLDLLDLRSTRRYKGDPKGQEENQKLPDLCGFRVARSLSRF